MSDASSVAPDAAPDDPRIASIEHSLFDSSAVVARSPLVTRVPADDVLAFHSEFPLVSYNLVTAIRYAGDPDRVRSRTQALLDEFFQRGHPFAWQATPSTTSPELEEMLLARGLETDPCTGLYADLSGDPVDPELPDGLRIELGPEPDVFGLAMATGNELPADFAEVVGATYRVYRPGEMLRLVVRDGDEPVASGALYVSGTTAGIYCVAVRPSHRRRGLGNAIVRVLTNVAGYQGCTHAVAHSTDDALPLFDRLGFDRVCPVPVYTWIPLLS